MDMRKGCVGPRRYGVCGDKLNMRARIFGGGRTNDMFARLSGDIAHMRKYVLCLIYG